MDYTKDPQPTQGNGTGNTSLPHDAASTTARQPIDLECVSQQTPHAPQKKKNVPVIAAIAIFVVLIVGGLIYYFNVSGQTREEEMAYEVLENNDNPEDYKSFLEKYPDSKYADEVKKRLSQLEQMLQEWNSIALSERSSDFIRFKDKYDDPRYERLCDIKIDSLDWVTAQRVGTDEALQHYLTAHPAGRYASEASVAMGTLRDQEITPEERDQVMTVCADFFRGFEEQDETAICSNISATMTQFLNKSNASKADVMKMISGMFNEHIVSCTFTVNRDFEIVKTAAQNGTFSFEASFTVDQHIERNNEGKTFGSYEVKALINSQYLITSLTMKQLSQQ